MIIYADVLIILNIYVNFLLLRTTGKLTHSSISFRRCIVSAVYGSLFSLLILVPNLNGILNIAIKLFAAVTIVAMAFGVYNKTRLCINIFCFFMANFIFAGVIYAVYTWLKPSFIHFNNTYFYVDFSLVILIAVTAALYILLCISRFILDKYPAAEGVYEVYIKHKGKTAVINGLADTGNSLVDFFSGKPVIICSRENIINVVNLGDGWSETESMPKGFRLIPYSTIRGDGMLPIFTPDEVLIINRFTKHKKRVDALIGIQSNEDNAIFNPRLLKL